MSQRLFEDKEHLVRLVGLFAVGLLIFLLLQALLVPKSFGVLGHYRADALDDNRAHPASFAGQAACEACHGDVADARKGGRHERVSCEACHGAQARHAEAEDPAAAKPARPDARLCLVCHAANVAKPKAFPQVVAHEHPGDGGSCLECHLAHRPGSAPEAKP